MATIEEEMADKKNQTARKKLHSKYNTDNLTNFIKIRLGKNDPELRRQLEEIVQQSMERTQHIEQTKGNETEHLTSNLCSMEGDILMTKVFFDCIPYSAKIFEINDWFETMMKRKQGVADIMMPNPAMLSAVLSAVTPADRLKCILRYGSDNRCIIHHAAAHWPSEALNKLLNSIHSRKDIYQVLCKQELVDEFTPQHFSVIHCRILTVRMMLSAVDTDQRLHLLQFADCSMWTPVTFSSPKQREVMETIWNSATPPQWVCLLEQSISNLNAASGKYGCDIRVQARRRLEKQLTKANILAAGHSATPKQERPPDRIKHETPPQRIKQKKPPAKIIQEMPPERKKMQYFITS